MLNKELISASLPVLSPTDKAHQALQLMADYHLIHLPVVSDEKFHGLIAEESLLNADAEATIASLQTDYIKLAVNAGTLFFQAVHMCNEYSLSLVPVIDKEMTWVGAISRADLLKTLSRTSGIDTPGGIIVLEMEQRNFSFSEISKLVETNDAQITQLNTYMDTNMPVFYVTIKVNKFEISDIIATFQRYEYHVKYYLGEELYENELRSNYDHLMNYLNI